MMRSVANWLGERCGWLSVALAILMVAPLAVGRINPRDRYGCYDWCRTKLVSDCQRCCRERRPDDATCEYKCGMYPRFSPVPCAEYSVAEGGCEGAR